MKPFESYSIGDLVIPRIKPRGDFPIFECWAFSGNYVFIHPLGTFGASGMIRAMKKDYTKARPKDIGKAVAHRIKR